MSLKIHVLHIVIDHVNTLYNYKTHSKWVDRGLFIGIPLLIAGILFIIMPIISGNLMTIISTVFTIFTALLLSLLLLIFDMSSKLKTLSQDAKFLPEGKAYNLLIETKTNISFLILTSIISLFVILFLAVISEGNIHCCLFYYLKMILSFISYLLLGIFGYTILMVLKRVYALLNEVLGVNNSPSRKK